MNRYINTPLFQIFILFLIWRISLFTVAFTSPILIRPNFGASFPYWQERLISSELPHFLWSFGNFDGVHYLGIARAGYYDQWVQTFFPLYPILIRTFSLVTGQNLLLAALIVSNLSFLGALYLFYKLLKEIFDKKIAFWSCLFLLAFPTSFYFGSVYTEGLFFLLVISSFYCLHKGKVLLASLIGAAASATRLPGVFLGLALAVTNARKSHFTIRSRFALPLLIVPVGLLLYMLYLKIEFNDPLYFLNAQSIFAQNRQTDRIILLPQVFFRYAKILGSAQGLNLANAIFELSSTIFALIAIISLYKKIKIEWFLFSVLAILLPTLTGTLASMPRYILIAFPIYLYLALIKNIKIKLTILALLVILLFVNTLLFTQGYWVA